MDKESIAQEIIFKLEMPKNSKEWWEIIVDSDRCGEMERKYNFYGHDQGVNSDDIEYMYNEEFNLQINNPNSFSIKSLIKK